MKPNELSHSGEFQNDFVERQLKCFGLAQYKSLMEQCFPTRIEYDELLKTYEIPTKSQPLVQRERTHYKQFQLSLLLRSVGLNRNDFKLGNTRICFRSLNSQILETILHPDKNDIERVISVYEKKMKMFRRWSTIVSNILESDILNRVAKTNQIVTKTDLISQPNVLHSSNLIRVHLHIVNSEIFHVDNS